MADAAPSGRCRARGIYRHTRSVSETAIKQLTPQRLSATSASTATIDYDDIQGDVLVGLQKNCEHFLFFKINDPPKFKRLLRTQIFERLTSTRLVIAREFQTRANSPNPAKGRPPDVLPLIGVNIGFTFNGLAQLQLTDAMPQSSFTAGAKAKAGVLGDPMNDDVPAWEPTFLNDDLHGVLIVTAGGKGDLETAVAELKGAIGNVVDFLPSAEGNVRTDHRGREHFDYVDGVSQPSIDGLGKAYPGQEVVDVGSVVLGAGDRPQPPPQPWMSNGSFMVFRKLEQFVPEFEVAIASNAAALGISGDEVKARLMGRWPSGAPFETSDQDDTVLGEDAERNNAFDYSDVGARCPLGAHVRKTNPRNGVPAPIMRAGIPYGETASAAERAANKTTSPRGLLFVCYQAAIENGFEFIHQMWANRPDFPSGGAGVDPFIGALSEQNRSENVASPSEQQPRLLASHAPFVVPRGGAYFFMPSMTAVVNELAGRDRSEP